MTSPKVFYQVQSYRSHQRAAQAYKKILAEHSALSSRPRSAIWIFHGEPVRPDLIAEMLNKHRPRKLIGYFVWEASSLPETYLESLKYVHEVWTCSRYCETIFRKFHDNVVYIPHVISRNLHHFDWNLRGIAKRISYDPRYTYCLTISRCWDKRKNLDAAIRIFLQAADENSALRLVVKLTKDDSSWISPDPRIVCIQQDLSERDLNALYSIANVYFAAHHSEGWGFPLSDALLFRKPLVAPQYSGNVDFMDEKSAFVIPTNEDFIKEEECSGLFTAKMKWGYPDENAGTLQLLRAAGGYDSLTTQRMLDRGLEFAREFSESRVAQKVLNRYNSYQRTTPSVG